MDDRRTGDLVARVRGGRRPAGVLAGVGDRLSTPDPFGGLAAPGAVTAALRRPAEHGKGGSCAARAPSPPR